jgi:hypothetical protein
LGVTGLSPVTVNGVPASVGRAEAPGAAEAVRPAETLRPAEAVGRAEAVGGVEAVLVTGAGPVGVGVAEHATDSAATAPAAATAMAARATLVI